MQITKEKIHKHCNLIILAGLAGVIISGNQSNYTLSVISLIILCIGALTYVFTEQDVKRGLKKLAILIVLIIVVALFLKNFGNIIRS